SGAETAPASRSVPVADARQEDKKRQAREAGLRARRDGDPRTPPEWMSQDLQDEWLAGYGEGIAEAASEAPAWFTDLTPEGRRQLAQRAGLSPSDAAWVSKINWPN